jgi:serine/threonine-protein kinase
MPELSIGERLAGAYQLCGLIGRGGMSLVYEAEDLALRRRVAIKLNTDDEDGTDLRREAQALAAVRHPGLPIVHGLGMHGGVPFLVMERLYGVSLEEDLRRVRMAAGGFPVADAVDILVALADVLADVHRAGLAHRDVKPANLMLCPRGRLVLLDFGIFLPEVEVARMSMCGTPRYMAPEMIRREVEPGQAHLADTYSFGAVACELLAGRPPFEADSWLEILEMHLRDAPPDLAAARPDAPAELVELVTACLAKAADQRPPSIEAVGWELRALARKLRAQPAAHPRVLIVDDDPDCADLMRDCVQDLLRGAHVRVVDSCEAALDLVRREPPALLLLDLGLPGMSGLDLCLRLRAMRLAARTEIIIVSGLVDDDSRRVLAQAGVRHMIDKGAALPERLGGIIHNVHRTRRATLRE